MFDDACVGLFREYILSYSGNLNTIKELKDGFENWFTGNTGREIRFSNSTYYRYLTSKKFLNYSYKKFKNATDLKNGTEELQERRINFARRLIYYSMLKYELIFVDETGFNLSYRPDYGYGMRNKDLRLQYISKKSTNYSLLCAISKDDIISYCIYEGPIHGEDYFGFIYNLSPMLDARTRNWILVCDNASIHKDKSQLPEAKKCINFLFLPPYTPHFNPIELLFGNIKREVRKRQYAYVSDLIFDIHHTITTYDVRKLRNLYRKMYDDMGYLLF
jgi:transposase